MLFTIGGVDYDAHVESVQRDNDVGRVMITITLPLAAPSLGKSGVVESISGLALRVVAREQYTDDDGTTYRLMLEKLGDSRMASR